MNSSVADTTLNHDEEMRLVNRLKNTDSAKFRQMCMMHLSILLDLPGTELDELLNDSTFAEDSKSRWTLFSKRKNSKGEKLNAVDGHLFGAPLTSDAIEQIETLITFLKKTENLQQEGLFRKSGHVSRQRVLREKMNSGEDVSEELSTGSYSAHDVANLLKAYLAELPEPLLLEKHYKAYCQIAGFVHTGLNEDLLQLRLSNQLQAVQLLVQLLPPNHVTLLQSLLQLLHSIASCTDANRMTPISLGTLFAPCVLVPRKMSGCDLQAAAPNVARVVAYMISNACNIMKIPSVLVRDIARYWEEMEEATENRMSAASEDETDSTCRYRYRKRSDKGDAVTTLVSFVDREASKQAASQTDTEVALAQLYAHVSAMPETEQKRRYLKQFNKANGKGSPANSQSRPAKHSRSKSFGESIKKMVSRNHRRRGSGKQSFDIHSSPPIHCTPHSKPVTIETPTVIDPSHTPIIKRTSVQNEGTPAPTTPVLKLFKTADVSKHILPSSPRVHIVDMKEETTTITSVARKRRLDSDTEQPKKLEKNLNRQLDMSAASPKSLLPVVRTKCINNDDDNEDEADKENKKSFPSTLMLHKQCLPINNPCTASSEMPSTLKTPEHKLKKASIMYSPISRSVSKAPKSVQANMMTPGCRRPMAVVQTP